MTDTTGLTNGLPTRLRIKADVISMGEKIAWGSVSELMREAAEALEATTQRVELLQHLVDHGQEAATAAAATARHLSDGLQREEWLRAALVDVLEMAQDYVDEGQDFCSMKMHQARWDRLNKARTALEGHPYE